MPTLAASPSLRYSKGVGERGSTQPLPVVVMTSRLARSKPPARSRSSNRKRSPPADVGAVEAGVGADRLDGRLLGGPLDLSPSGPAPRRSGPPDRASPRHQRTLTAGPQLRSWGWTTPSSVSRSPTLADRSITTTKPRSRTPLNTRAVNATTAPSPRARAARGAGVPREPPRRTPVEAAQAAPERHQGDEDHGRDDRGEQHAPRPGGPGSMPTSALDCRFHTMPATRAATAADGQHPEVDPPRPGRGSAAGPGRAAPGPPRRRSPRRGSRTPRSIPATSPW